MHTHAYSESTFFVLGFTLRQGTHDQIFHSGINRDHLNQLPPSIRPSEMSWDKLGAGGDGEEPDAPLSGDLLATILSHLPLLHLVPASYVSKTWRLAASHSLRRVTHSKPWLLLHHQSHIKAAAVTIHAYDPETQTWVRIPRPITASDPISGPLRASHASLIYAFSPSQLSVSFDALNAEWLNFGSTRVWRVDPVIAKVGPHLVIAGGTCEFEDETLAVEAFHVGTRLHRTCEPMPPLFKNSASRTLLSVAASDRNMYVLDKSSGRFYWFEPESSIWGPPANLRPDPAVFFSVIGFSDGRLIQAGLIGDGTEASEIKIWEVHCDDLDRKLIGKMPPAMMERLKNLDSSLTSIEISAATDWVYVYNPSNPKEIVYCDFSGGECRWGNLTNPVLDDRNPLDRFEFTSSRVGIDDLRSAFRRRNEGKLRQV